MKHVELEQFLHASASRGFVSVSWAFLYMSGIRYLKGAGLYKTAP